MTISQQSFIYHTNTNSFSIMHSPMTESKKALI